MIAFTLCSVIVDSPWFRLILKLESKNHFIFITVNSIYCGAKYWSMIKIPSVFHFITLYHLIIFLGSSSNGFSFFLHSPSCSAVIITFLDQFHISWSLSLSCFSPKSSGALIISWDFTSLLVCCLLSSHLFSWTSFSWRLLSFLCSLINFAFLGLCITADLGFYHSPSLNPLFVELHVIILVLFFAEVHFHVAS